MIRSMRIAQRRRIAASMPRSASNDFDIAAPAALGAQRAPRWAELLLWLVGDWRWHKSARNPNALTAMLPLFAVTSGSEHLLSARAFYAGLPGRGFSAIQASGRFSRE